MLPAMSNDSILAQLRSQASHKALMYLADGCARPELRRWGSATYQVNKKKQVMKGGSFDALMAFFTHDDAFIVDSAMVELIAVKLAVGHAKFYVQSHPEDFNKPLHVIVDNTSMWSNRFAGGSAPPLKPPLRKMMDVVLASI